MKGHMRKRGNVWYFVLDLGVDENGKRQQKWFRGDADYKIAEKKMIKKINEINEGEYIEPSRQTLRSYLTGWLEDKKNEVEYNTFLQYRTNVNKHIIPALGNVKLEALKPQHVKKFFVRLAKSDLSKQTQKHIYTTLRTALNEAVDIEILTRNVVKKIKPPRVRKNEMKVWNWDEARKFIASAQNERYFIAYLIALNTGMRQGEICGLKWPEVDFKKNTILVARAVVRKESGYVIRGYAKSSAGYRTIKVDEKTMMYLKRHKNKQAQKKLSMGENYEDNQFVTATSLGTFLRPNKLGEYFSKAVDKSGLKKITFHNLRHTHATLLFSDPKRPAHPRAVQERLGHSSIQITLQTYSHVLPSLQDAVADNFGSEIFDEDAQNLNLI